MIKIVSKMANTPWNIIKEMEEWKNGRIIETYISDESVDFHGDVVSLDAIKERLPWLCEHGFYEYQHSDFPIGEFLAWRIEDDKAKVRVGIFDSETSKLVEHDKIWKEIVRMGEKGESSIKGITNEEHKVAVDGNEVNRIEDIGLWAVGWVGDNAANPNADVTFVNELAKLKTKAKEIAINIKNNTQIIEVEDMGNGIKKEEEEEMPPEEAAPEEEAPPVEGGNVEEAVAVIAEALSDLDAGTPEAVAEVADAGAEALEVLAGEGEEEYEEMKKAKIDLETKLIEAAKVIKSLTAEMATLQKRLETPVTQKRNVPVQPAGKVVTKSVIDFDNIEKLFGNRNTAAGFKELGFRHK